MSIKIKKDIYEKTFIISNVSTNSNNKKLVTYINSKFTTDGIIKIDANYNYSMMKLIISAMYINSITTIKNLKKLK